MNKKQENIKKKGTPPIWQITKEHYIVIHHEYKTWLKTIGYSAKTIKLYSQDVLEFLHFLEVKKVHHITDVTELQVLKYKDYLHRRSSQTKIGGLTQSTINIKLRSVKSLGTYLMRTKGMLLELYVPKEEQTHEKSIVLTEAEVNKIYAQTYHHKHYYIGLRDRILLHLYYGCGLRRREGIELDVNDVNIHKGTLRIVGKNQKERYVPMASKLLTDFEEYLEKGRDWYLQSNERRKRVLKNVDKEAFLLSIRGTRFHYTSISSRLDYWRKKSGLNKQFRC